jgi:hypothetical protein
VARKCVFCERDVATLEHIYAEWLSEIVPGEGEMVHERGPVFPPGDDGGETWRHPRLFTLTVRATCEDCNTGWMNRLEERVKPLITLPIQGERQTLKTGVEQTSVAAWAFKTALMLDCAQQKGVRHVPRQHYRYLYHFRHPPPNVHVRLLPYGFHEGQEYHPAWVKRTRLTVNSGFGDFKGYSFTFSVGHLVFQVFGVLSPQEFNVRRNTRRPDGTEIDFLRQIWPLGVEPITWPPSSGFDAEGLDFLSP